MKTEELIEKVLEDIRKKFYADRIREFKRDERALLKAVARYGSECESRGWNVDANFICQDILALLYRIKASGADIEYLPVYLHSAISKHINYRAEEISAEAKTINMKVTKVVKGVNIVEAVVEPTTVEVLATVYKNLHSLRKKKKQQKNKTKERQEELL